MTKHCHLKFVFGGKVQIFREKVGKIYKLKYASKKLGTGEFSLFRSWSQNNLWTIQKACSGDGGSSVIEESYNILLPKDVLKLSDSQREKLNSTTNFAHHLKSMSTSLGLTESSANF